MATDPPPNQPHDLANLRLEVSALTAKINAESLPEQLKAVRRTIAWAAVGISFALVLSGVLHMWASSKYERLEQRIEVLEKKSP